jgi:hypothetical protein
MPDAFDLELNTKEVVFALNRLKREQIPFAQSLALNFTLKDAQAEVRKQLPRRFSIRRPWVPRGVVVKPSNKRQLWGSIVQRDPFMARQEFGGQKTPQGKAIAVPVGELARLAKTKVLSKGKRPAAQMRKKGVYRGETKAGVPAIIKRGTARRRAEVLYLLIPTARIEPRFEFAPTVLRTARKVWPKNFGKALARAIATAR